MNDYSVVDIFCGVGGLSHGLFKEGFKVKAGIDADETCRYPYEANNHAEFIHKKIEDVTPEEIKTFYSDSDIKILVGCAPCQPFSTYNQNKEDDQWQLLYRFAELIAMVKPDIVSMENVTRLRKFKKGKIFNDFVECLEKNNFSVTYNDVFCPDYGIPQNRTRLVLFASKRGKVELINKTHTPENYTTVEDYIYSLEPITQGETSRSDKLHRACSLSETNLKRIRSSIPGGTWRDWDNDLIAECHKKKTGKTYPSVYGRMSWNEPAPTITTQYYGYGNGRFGHPDQDRAISHREAAILQTFPPDYRFVEQDKDYPTKTLGRHIGNAVPVDLGRVIGKSLKKHIKEYYE